MPLFAMRKVRTLASCKEIQGFFASLRMTGLGRGRMICVGIPT